MDNLKKDLKHSSDSINQDLQNEKPLIYSSLNLLSESETESLKRFLEETCDNMAKEYGINVMVK